MDASSPDLWSREWRFGWEVPVGEVEWREGEEERQGTGPEAGYEGVVDWWDWILVVLGGIGVVLGLWLVLITCTWCAIGGVL